MKSAWGFRLPLAALTAIVFAVDGLSGEAAVVGDPPLSTDEPHAVAESTPESQYLAALRAKAESGNADAQFELGTTYLLGVGCPKDEIQAAAWFRRAANQGHEAASLSLGHMCEKGTGVPEDLAEAARWFRKAAESGNADAQFSLGRMYDAGRGVPKDQTEATTWFRKAAEQGDGDYQFAIGMRYGLGVGAPKDLVQGYMWFNLAAANGSQLAARGRSELERAMTGSQIAEAQRLSREFASRKAVPDGAEPARSGTKTAPELKATGTGFFITANGYMVTAAHVVEGGTSFKVLTAAGERPAGLVRSDAANDLAVLKVHAQSTPVPIAPSRAVRLGETVATVGFPNVGLQGFSPKLAKGEIAGLAGAQDDPRHFQVSIPVQPGNSGGAVLNGKGNVVGVAVAKLSRQVAIATSGTPPENVNYAVKSGFLLSLLESLPEVAAGLPEPDAKELPFEEVVNRAERAATLVLVY